MTAALLQPRTAPRRLPKPLPQKEQVKAWVLAGALTLVCLLVYLDSLWMTAQSWRSPQYSHGFLIPAFVAALLWHRRQRWLETTAIERWCGVGVILASLLVRIVSAYYTTFTPDNLSLIPCLLGVLLIVGGWRSLLWAGPPVLFLVFMYPWPDRLESLILVQLKARFAMPMSLFSLQVLGVESYLSGNIIELGDGTKMNVVDACAGLGMLNIFLALAAAFAMLLTWRPVWERCVLFLSAVPIALIANAARITVEGLIFYYGPSLFSEAAVTTIAGIFHDYLASWFMMLLAMGLLYIEYHVLRRLVIEEDVGESLRRHLPSAPPAKS